MGRHSNLPGFFEDCKIIDISKLKGWGYIQPSIIKTGQLTWSSNGQQTAKIGIAVALDEVTGTLTLNYTCNNEPICYKVQLISKPANIGNGLLWFFVCPKTGRVCRKLHLGDKYFLHRTAFTGYIYELQTWSAKTRYLYKTPIYLEVKADSIYDQIYTKHFKKYYNGKPTKQYVRLLKQIGERPNKYAIK